MGNGNSRCGKPITAGIETFSVTHKTRKLMLVCSEISNDLETCLVCDGWVVVRVYDAQTAIAKVRQEHFDMAVLISTGKEMDVTETLFNLKDIRESLSIVMLRRPDDANKPGAHEPYLQSGSTKVRSEQDLEGLLTLLRDNEHAESAMGLL